MKIRKKIALLLPILLLSACGDEVAPTATTPSTSTKNATGITTLIKKGALSLIISDEKTKKPIEKATVKVIDGNNKAKEQKTDVDGLSTFKDLPEGDNYRIEVTATDYISKTLSTIDSKLEIKQDGATVINITLGKILSTITGKVVSNTGSAIDSAVVKLNDLTSITDANGMFSIKTGANISGKITASKIGFSSASSNNINVTDWNKTFDAGSLTLSKSTKNTEVVFDTSKTPFGNTEGDNINLLKDLGTLLTKNKFNVNYSDMKTLNLDTIDILVLPCPSTEYTTSEIEKMVKFVKAGKKLIVLGEWAGYLGFSYDSANKILKEANLKISPNILKEINSTNYSFNPEYIVTSNYTDHFITKSLGKTAFYSSASVEVIDGGIAKLDTENTKTLAFSSAASFRVQTYIKGASGLIGVSLLGLGKVVALGDSSIFTNSDSDNDKILNLNEENNSKLALNIFNW